MCAAVFLCVVITITAPPPPPSQIYNTSRQWWGTVTYTVTVKNRYGIILWRIANLIQTWKLYLKIASPDGNNKSQILHLQKQTHLANSRFFDPFRSWIYSSGWLVFTGVWQLSEREPGKNETPCQRRFNGGSTSQTLAHLWAGVGPLFKGLSERALIWTDALFMSGHNAKLTVIAPARRFNSNMIAALIPAITCCSSSS